MRSTQMPESDDQMLFGNELACIAPWRTQSAEDIDTTLAHLSIVPAAITGSK